MNLNEAMSAAAEKLSGESTEPVTEAAPEAVETQPTETTETAPRAERVRDESGRFTKTDEPTKKPPAAPKGDVHGAAQAAPPAGPGKVEGAASPTAPSTDPVKPAEPPVKLPSSWKPAAREALAKAPREVQEEAVRIDREVRQVMQESAEARKTAEQVSRTLAPFEGLARANGMDAMSYAGSVLQSAAQLFQGPPQTRAAIIAQLIQQSGADVEAINAAMQGQPGPAQAAPQQRQPAFDPRAEVQRVLEEERTQSALRDFQASQPEFLDDVWQEMVAIIEADKRLGRNPDLGRAYDRACRMNEDVSKILEQRKAAGAARTATAATQAAKAAAVSIKSRPAAPMSAKPKGLDGAMAAAREKLGM